MSLAETKNNQEIIDINLDGVSRTRFRINGDPDAVIELNLSDMRFLERLEKGMKQLQEDVTEIAKIPDDDEDLSGKLKQVDNKMREQVDYIFDYPVSAVCAKYGTMYDPKDGKFRYETILEGLVKLYAENIRDEYKKLQSRVKKHTAKYTAPVAVKSRKK